MDLTKLTPLRIYYYIIVTYVLNSNSNRDIKGLDLSLELKTLYSKYSFEFLYYIHDIILSPTTIINNININSNENSNSNTNTNGIQKEEYSYSTLMQLLVQYLSNNCSLDTNNNNTNNNIDNNTNILKNEINLIIQHISNIFNPQHGPGLDRYIEILNSVTSTCSILLNTQNMETINTSGVVGPFACSKTSEMGADNK